jgi:hypothetical protein
VTGNTCIDLVTATQLWLNTLADQLWQTISDAVANVKAAYPSMRLLAVDARAAFAGHGVCAVGAQKWINGIIVDNGSASFHPTAVGQAGYATLVNAALQRFLGWRNASRVAPAVFTGVSRWSVPDPAAAGPNGVVEVSSEPKAPMKLLVPAAQLEVLTP